MEEQISGLPDVPEVDVGDRLVLRERFVALQAAARAAGAAVAGRDAALPAYLARIKPRANGEPAATLITPATLEGGEARNVLGAALATLTYADGQHPQALTRLPGVIACSAATLDALKALNAAKAEFEELASTLTQKQWTALRRRRDYARLQLLSCYRTVPVLAQVPDRVSIGWLQNGASMQRLSAARARELVITSLGRAFEMSARQKQELQAEELAQLAGVPADEQLVVRRALPPVPEVNWWFDDEAQAPIKGVLPLAFPATPGGAWPEIRRLGPLAVRPPRIERADARIEAEPLIDRLDLFRYRPEWRRLISQDAPATPESVQLEYGRIHFGPAQPPVTLGLDDATWSILLQALSAALLGQGVQNIPTSGGTLRVIRRARGLGLSFHDARGEVINGGLLSRTAAAAAIAR